MQYVFRTALLVGVSISSAVSLTGCLGMKDMVASPIASDTSATSLAASQCQVSAVSGGVKITCLDGSSANLTNGTNGADGAAGAAGAAGANGPSGSGMIAKDPVTGVQIGSVYIGYRMYYEVVFDSSTQTSFGYDASGALAITGTLYYAQAGCAGQVYTVATTFSNMALAYGSTGTFYRTSGAQSFITVMSEQAAGSATCIDDSSSPYMNQVMTANLFSLPSSIPLTVNLPFQITTP